MALQSNNCDQLLSFVAQTTNGIQEAFLKKRKGKHVNPRKFIQKRLNRGGSKPVRPQNKPTKQAATSAATSLDRHCVAPGVFPGTEPLCSWGQTSMPSAAPSPSPSYNCFASYGGYPETTPSSYSEVSTYSRPPSCQDEIDPELESLLSEFGLDSPPSSSQCTGSPNSCAVSRCGSGVGFLPTSTSFEAILGTDLLSSEQQYPFSPRSDYSDIDDSAYSSPLNSSPACPAYYQQHMSGIASCEWLPPTCSSIAAQPAVQFTLPVHVPSHREIIDMLATPTQ